MTMEAERKKRPGKKHVLNREQGTILYSSSIDMEAGLAYYFYGCEKTLLIIYA